MLLPADVLVSILGQYQASPHVALTLSLCSKTMFDHMEDCWGALFQHWSKRFGDSKPHMYQQQELETYRKSTRLKNKEYYTNRFQFLRLIRLARVNCNQANTEITNFPQAGFASRLKRLLHSSVPVWPSNAMLQTSLLAKNLLPQQALGITQELVLQWGAEVDSAVLCIASARGFDKVIEFVLQQQQQQRADGGEHWKNRAHKFTFTLTVNQTRKQITGKHNAMEWSQTMLIVMDNDAAIQRLKRCIKLLK